MAANEARRAQMNDPKSDLRNQVSKDDVADFQLLSNTPVRIIMAMTDYTQDELQKRADSLGVTLKGDLAATGGQR
jgi:hypothetical protein